jgi:hypothetical protein
MSEERIRNEEDNAGAEPLTAEELAEVAGGGAIEARAKTFFNEENAK